MNLIRYSELNVDILPGKSKQGSVVERPCTKIDYGQFPANNFGFPVGDIVLKLGYKGYGRLKTGATGLRHIWDKHRNEIGLSCPSEIPPFLETVIRPGADVLVDHTKNADRPLVLTSTTGIAVLGHKVVEGKDIYEVITAYIRRQHRGTLIGNL